MAGLKLTNIKKSYGKVEVMHGVDLEIEKGEFIVFVGPSGCGKSTLLRMIAGLESITDGELQIDGKRVNEVPPSLRGIAMVFQSYALYPHMTVYDNMAFSLRITKASKAEIDKRVHESAEMLQLTEYLNRLPKALSGGQRQRVAIGRAIVRNPKVFLFDEPLSNLDAELRVDMRLQISSLHCELATTMIYVTHDQVEAMTLADKIVVLRDGRIEQVGSPLELYNRPANEFVAGFIGSPKMNMLPAKVTHIGEDGATLKLPDGQSVTLHIDLSKVAVGDKLTFGLRPEHLSVGGEGDYSLHFKTDAVERLGNSTYLFGVIGGYENNKVHLSGDVAVKRGEEIELTFNRENCHVFKDSLCISNL